MVVALGVRLHEGPVRVDWVRSILASRIEAALPHTHAAIGHVDFMWFSAPRALGFRMQDVAVDDHAGRMIAHANRVEMALAADSLLFLHFMPARVTAQDFFIAASVSKEGRYDLGYDAHGAPGASDLSLQAFVDDLTGPEHLNRPLSFTRQIRLTNGTLRLVQEGGGLDWSSHVATIDYSKLHNRLKARLDLGVTSQGAQAHLLAMAEGKVGLSQAQISAQIEHLNPARVFPAVGATRVLSTVDAPVDGMARVNYSATTGFDGGAIDLRVGSGHAVFGHSQQVFDGAAVKATYDARTRTLSFGKLQVKARLIDADLKGAMHISPEDVRRHKDMSLDFDVYGPRLTGMLADDFAPQTLIDAHYRGSYVPAQRSFRFASATGKLNGAPLDAQGLLYTDDKGQLGADLTAHIKGRFTKDEVFAFWPQDLSHPLRDDLIKRIKSGDFENANYVMKVKPGDFGHLTNDSLRLDFDFHNATLGIEKRMADATELRGHGRLEGASFKMDVSSGRLVNVTLDKGGIDVPDFHDHNQRVRIWLDAHADVPSVIEAVDPITDNQLSPHGLNRDRLSGQAEGHVEISFPTYHKIDAQSLNVVFNGHIHDGGFKQAALGWDLTQGEVTISGDLLANKLDVRGPGKLGPYSGDIDYATQMLPRTQVITINGHFNAAPFGGSPKVPVPIKGQFTVVGNKGSGSIDAAIFRGNVDWSGTEARPTQVNIAGVTLSDGMEDQGLPIFDHLDRELPTRITLLRSGEIWAGLVDAQALSGDIAYIEGLQPRLVYKATITPDEARQLGYGGLPMFSAPRRLTIDIALDSQSHSADIKLDQIDATLGWSAIAGTDELERRLTAELVPDDWATLGLPKTFFRPRAPMEVTALWSQNDTELRGSAMVSGQKISFEMPLAKRVLSPLSGGPLQAPLPEAPRTGEDSYFLKVTGTVDDTMLNALGYTQSPVRVAGPTAMVLRLYNTPGQPAGVLNVDATQTQLGVQATDWKKPVGEVAQFAISFDDQGATHGVNLSHIVGQGDHVQIDGRASFSDKGDLQFAEFSKIYLKDFIDVSLKYYDLPDQSRRVFAVSGQQLDLRPWLQAKPADLAVAGNAAPEQATMAAAAPESTHVVVDLGRLQTSAEGAFTNLKLDVAWDGKSGFDGQGAGHTLSGAPVSLLVRGEGGYSVFRLKTDDLGDVVRTATGVPNLVGGHAELAGVYMDGQVDAELTGKAIRVKQVPAMAQLLTVATMTGLNDTLAGDGIAFTDFKVPVRYRDHTLFVRDGWVKGKGLGMDMWGTTNLDAKTLDLTGTLIPAYSVNSLFGALPSKGLGLVGLKYQLAGTYAAPRAMVNPLSIVMPGFIKVWQNKESRGRDPIAALNLPKAEQQLAQLRQQEKTQD